MGNIPPYKIDTTIFRHIPIGLDKWKEEYSPIHEGMSMENVDMKSIIENNQDLIFCSIGHDPSKTKPEGLWFLFPKKQFLPPMDKELKEEIKKVCPDSEIDVGMQFLITSLIRKNTNYSRAAIHYLLEEGIIGDDINFIMGVVKEEENSEVDYQCVIRCLAITPNPIVYN